MTDTPAPRSRGKFRRWKRRFMDGFFHLAGAPAIGGIFTLLARTLKLRYDGYEHYEQVLRSGRPVVLAFFHEDLLSIFIAHLRVHPCRVGVMLSQSRDGEKLAQIIERHDLVPIRASSSRGAVRGFLELYRWLKTKRDYPTVGAIAIDGPRGPRRQAKAGVCMLARKAGALILPVAFNHSRKVVFRSWDRMLLPKLFATTTAYVHEPIDAALWSEDDEANARLLSDVLVKLKEKAGLP